MVPFSSTPPGSPVSAEKANPLAVFFFALMFFLCSSDLFFTTRIGGFNFRWGQWFLILAALPAGLSLIKKRGETSPFGKIQTRLMLNWVPFFALYGLAALCSATPVLTGIKWGWGVFNIGLAALVCLQPRRSETLEKGFEWGILAIASLLWLQTIALYVLPFLTRVQNHGEGCPSPVSFLSVFLGYAQTSFFYKGMWFFRPNAFYYEPSYAGGALSFALFLPAFFDLKRLPERRGFLSAIVLTSILLCSSRTGIVSAIIFLLLVFAFSVHRPENQPLRQSCMRMMVFSTVLIGAFCLFPLGRQYIGFISGPIGIDTYARLNNKISSENERLENMMDSLHLWADHPLLGNGVIKQGSENPGLSQVSGVTWFEIGLESGILGVIAFLFAIGASMKLAWNQHAPHPIKTIILSCWIVHFGFQFFFSQTFPRLDSWLLFFLSIRLMLGKDDHSPIQPEPSHGLHPVRLN